jgi:hypothetical protein
MKVGQWVRVEGNDDSRAMSGPFKLLHVRYFISNNSNLSHEGQYQDMKVKHGMIDLVLFDEFETS